MTMLSDVRTALGNVLGGPTVLRRAAGRGRLFQLFVQTGIAARLQNHGLEVWLQRSDGSRIHPDRTEDEIREWAHEHDLPYFDEEVHFPDLRIEYRDRDGFEEHQDIEVVTPHYRGAHAASVGRSGFSCYGGWSLRITAHSGSHGGGGRRRGPIEEFLD